MKTPPHSFFSFFWPFPSAQRTFHRFNTIKKCCCSPPGTFWALSASKPGSHPYFFCCYFQWLWKGMYLTALPVTSTPAPSAEQGKQEPNPLQTPHLNFLLSLPLGMLENSCSCLAPLEQPYPVWYSENIRLTGTQKPIHFTCLDLKIDFSMCSLWMDRNNFSFSLYRNNFISDPLFWKDAIDSQGFIQKFLWVQRHPRRHLTWIVNPSKKMQWCFNYKSAKSSEILEKIKQCALLLELQYQIKLHNGSTFKFFPQIPSQYNEIKLLTGEVF